MAPAAQIVLNGGVVAYPTETVYGLGANALDERAVRRVFQIKGRSSDKPLIVLVRHRRQLKSLVKEVPPWAKTLMDRFWPDGLTLVLEASQEMPGEVLGGGSTIALRISGNRVVRALLNLARVPITAPSANLAGRPSPLTAEEVQEQLGDRVDLILDGGRASQATPSTILDVREEPTTLLRQGRIPLDEIRRVVAVREPGRPKLTSPSRILLVCTGNTCRSAMAEGLLRKMLEDQGAGHIRVSSAGTHAAEGESAAQWSQEVSLDEGDVDLSRHRARRLTRDLLREADLVLTMTLSHARHVERMGKRFAQKTYLLTSFPRSSQRDPEDIEDPLGGSRRAYQNAFRRIKRELERILPALVSAPRSECL
jgi:tRNA threonylcarbamoyl adenosine modification protein (Sua5/YciO/YrdC/YwlC family)